MGSERSIGVPVAVSVGLLIVALVFHVSWLGVLLALGAAVPAAYVTWLGTQSEAQTRMVMGLLLMLASVAVAALILIGRVLGWLA